MRIGIDLDGVVFDTEKAFRIYSELYDIEVLKRNSLINNQEVRFQKRYNWSEEEQEDFLKMYHETITTETNFMPGAQEVLRLLKQEGHELIIITARGGWNKKMIDITNKRLKESKMDIFDRYYFRTENKAEVCKNENIDVMIDDSYEKCKSISENKIKTVYLKDAPSYNLENEYVKVLYNWGEIYRYIKELENK